MFQDEDQIASALTVPQLHVASGDLACGLRLTLRVDHEPSS